MEFRWHDVNAASGAISSDGGDSAFLNALCLTVYPEWVAYVVIIVVQLQECLLYMSLSPSSPTQQSIPQSPELSSPHSWGPQGLQRAWHTMNSQRVFYTLVSEEMNQWKPNFNPYWGVLLLHWMQAFLVLREATNCNFVQPYLQFWAAKPSPTINRVHRSGLTPSECRWYTISILKNAQFQGVMLIYICMPIHIKILLIILEPLRLSPLPISPF